MSSYKRVVEASVPSLFALVIGLIAGAILMRVYGYHPLLAYKALFSGAFGSFTKFAETLSYAIPLMLTGLTFAISMRAGLFNIGAEGQVYMGAIGAVIGGTIVSLPHPLHLAFATLMAMLFGLLWSLGPALLKAWRGVHEVISTIMFNWIAYYGTMYLASSVLCDPNRPEKTLSVLESARYGVMVKGSSLTSVLFVAIAFNIIVYLYLTLTKSGYELRVYGANPDAAKYAGVSAKRVVMTSFLIGGLAAGLAGATQILGRPPTWALYGNLGNVMNLGFDGIGVALIGRNNPIGIIIASVFFGALKSGGRYMEYQAHVCSELVEAINGLIVIALSIPEVLEIIRRYRIRRRLRT